MKIFRKTLITLCLLVVTLIPLGFQTVYAQAPFSLLPTAKVPENCNNTMDIFETTADHSALFKVPGNREEVLACGINTGRISLELIPYYITYIANFILSLVGLVCILFIVVGGYYYIYGGIEGNKEKGKKTIYHALLGMSLAILAWVIVNIVIAAVTS